MGKRVLFIMMVLYELVLSKWGSNETRVDAGIKSIELIGLSLNILGNECANRAFSYICGELLTGNIMHRVYFQKATQGAQIGLQKGTIAVGQIGAETLIHTAHLPN